jgi:hypothetical protein
MQLCVISTSTASDALASPFRDSCPKEAFSRSISVVSQSVCRTSRALAAISSDAQDALVLAQERDATFAPARSFTQL